MPYARRTQAGFSLIELLIVSVLGLIVLGAFLSLVTAILKYRKQVASHAQLQEQAQYLSAQLQEDIAAAGSGTGPGARNLLRNQLTNSPQPGAFISEAGKVLTIAKTVKEETGKIVAVTGSQAVIGAVTKGVWLGYPAGKRLLMISSTGNPVLVQLTGAPRETVATDLPLVSGDYPEVLRENTDLERCVTVSLQTGSVQCAVTDSLGSTPSEGALAVPITSLVQYQLSNSHDNVIVNQGADSLYRLEFNNCLQRSGPQYRTPIAPLSTDSVQFKYVTTGGTVDAVPADLSTLRGIWVDIQLRDPSTGLTFQKPFEVIVAEWAKTEVIP